MIELSKGELKTIMEALKTERVQMHDAVYKTKLPFTLESIAKEKYDKNCDVNRKLRNYLDSMTNI